MNPRRPLTVGETLNEVFALYQGNFGVLIPAAFWLFLGVNIITGIAGNHNTGLLLVGAILTFAVALLYQGMVVSLVRDLRDGSREESVTELISSVGPVLPTLIGASILYAIGVAVGFVFLVVPGCILLTIWAVIAPVIVIERSGIGAAFGRSQELVRNHGWTVFGTVVAATLISLVAALVLTSIAEAIAGGPILRIVFSTLASTFTAPVGALVAAILYYRLRELKGDGNPMMPPKLGPDA
jgi:hypothetical protein